MNLEFILELLNGFFFGDLIVKSVVFQDPKILPIFLTFSPTLYLCNKAMPISRRMGFSRLLDKMEKGDILVVTKLDRLGRDAIDVSSTVVHLESIGIKVYCLALGGVDLTSAAGKMTMGVINSVAEFERDLLIERTQSGLARAKLQGKKLGRPNLLSELQRQEVIKQLQDGISIASIAKNFSTSRQTIMRIRRSAGF